MPNRQFTEVFEALGSWSWYEVEHSLSWDLSYYHSPPHGPQWTIHEWGHPPESLPTAWEVV